jgi:hypothetical protein
MNDKLIDQRAALDAALRKARETSSEASKQYVGAKNDVLKFDAANPEVMAGLNKLAGANKVAAKGAEA